MLIDHINKITNDQIEANLEKIRFVHPEAYNKYLSEYRSGELVRRWKQIAYEGRNHLEEQGEFRAALAKLMESDCDVATAFARIRDGAGF